MSFTYIRSADGAAASEAEALDANRRLRPGFKFGPIGDGQHIGFAAAFMDSAHRAPTPTFAMADATRSNTMLTDAEIVFRDSPEGREAVAFARSCVAARDAFGGTRTWTDADERIAIQNALRARDHARQRTAAYQAARPALQAAEAAALQATRDHFRDNRHSY